MSYLDESRLSTYDSNLKEWISSQESKTITSSIYPWTKTAKTSVVSCYPVSGTELKPVVDFLFAETPPASGDKGPENPSTLIGVESVKVTKCGKNLCPLIGESSSSYISVSFTDNGEFVFDGSYVGLVDVYIFNKTYNKNSFPNYLERGKTYTFSLQGDNSSVKFQAYVYQTSNYGGAVVSIAPGESQTYTIPDTQSMILRFSIPANTVLNNAKFKLQIEEGSSATEFEPYAGTDYPLPLGNTYYGGTLDVASGVMIVTYASVALNENTYLSGQIFEELSDVYVVGFYPNPARFRPMTSVSQAGCSILPIKIGTGAKNLQCIYLADNALAVRIQIAKTELGLGDGASISTVQTAVHSWFGSHPGVLVYPVATPTTVQLDPVSISALAQSDKYTPRLNTVYTDASAVQVGYVKSPIREEQELQQAIVSQGGNV